jgi:very-short-patch-repair endonuclease
MPVFRQRNTARARELRNNATPAERRLWLQLQGRKLDGYKFSRQLEMAGPFYGDFVCRSHKLIIELDGGSHDFTADADAGRTQRLERLGYQVIRFTNGDVLQHLDGVLLVIAQTLRDRPTPARSASFPSRKREGR